MMIDLQQPRIFRDPQFTCTILRNVGDSGLHLWVAQHSNFTCVLGICPDSPIFSKNITVVSVDFNAGKRVDRAALQVRGKGKKGSLHCSHETLLCVLTLSDGSDVPVLCGIRAKLLQVNGRLKDTPDLLRTDGFDTGYLSVMTMFRHGASVPQNDS
jgi:hypothetical protein